MFHLECVNQAQGVTRAGEEVNNDLLAARFYVFKRRVCPHLVDLYCLNSSSQPDGRSDSWTTASRSLREVVCVVVSCASSWSQMASSSSTFATIRRCSARGGRGSLTSIRFEAL